MDARSGLPEIVSTARTPSSGEARGIEGFFEQSVDMLCLAGVDGYFKVVNPAWTRVLGHTVAELMATPYLDFVHPDDRQATASEASKLARGFRTVHFRNRYRSCDGTYKWLAWTASPALADGTIYASARDITDAVAVERKAPIAAAATIKRVHAAIAGRNFTVVFQPIVRVSIGQVCGLEALSRFTTRPPRTPDIVFAEAEALGSRAELEMSAISKALRSVGGLPASVFLSLNASPRTLLLPSFQECLKGLPGEQLVIEVTENAVVEDYDNLRRALGSLRRNGLRLAIDDAGAGFASLKHVIELAPDFIKLDLFLVRGIDADPVKRALVAALLAFARDIGSVLIAEGVETAAELQALKELHVDLAQGYYLGKPAPFPRHAGGYSIIC